MKTAVIYRSMTGHSKKIARAIATELNLNAQNIKAKPQLDNVDLLFVVGGVYSGESLSGMREYIETLTADNVKKAALVTSSATDKKGQDDVRKLLTEAGIEVLPEEYRCLGNFLLLKMGHPNKKEIAGAVDFAKMIIKNELAAESCKR